MELTAEEAWSRILKTARARLPEHSYATWLAPTSACALSESRLSVSAPSAFAVEWIEHKYGSLIDEITRRVLGDRVTVNFESRGESPEAEPIPRQATAADIARPLQTEPAAEVRAPGEAVPRRGDSGCVVGTLNPRYTLERFVVGSNNQFSVAACRAVAAAPGRAYNPLFIYGGVGLGKTHLMHGIGHTVLHAFPDRRAAYVPTEQFLNEMVASIQARSTPEFRRRYREIDLLLVDDVHFLADREGTQEEFFHTFNALYDAQKQIVLTSDRPPKEIPGLQERLVSRFEWGLVTDVQAPGFETRVAILQQKAEEDGLAIDREVLSFIAERCRSSVRELEGAIIKLLAYSSLTRREITVALAEEALGSRIGRRLELSPERIQAAVAEAFGISVEAMRSKSRARAVTHPRQVAMYFMRTLLELPYTQIGSHFGGRDHSTVIHSIRKVEQERSGDQSFQEQLRSLELSLGAR